MQYQEFTDARALRMHYREVRARLTAPRPSLAAASDTKDQRPATRKVPIRVTTLQECRPVRGVVFKGRVYGPFPIARDFMHLNAPEYRDPTTRKFIADFARERGFTYADMVSDLRTQPLTRYRQDCMLALKRAFPKMSYPSIGRAFGGRDHTTAMHGIKRAIKREEHEAGE